MPSHFGLRFGDIAAVAGQSGAGASSVLAGLDPATYASVGANRERRPSGGKLCFKGASAESVIAAAWLAGSGAAMTSDGRSA
jgi:hypothetical protein